MSAPPQIALISSVNEDLAFANSLAEQLGSKVFTFLKRDPVRAFLVNHPTSIVLWDADSQTRYEAMGEILNKYVSPKKVFALTSGPLQNYPELFNYQAFDHHFVRRFSPGALTLATALARGTFGGEHHALSGFFPSDVVAKRIPIVWASTHRKAAIEAFQRHLSNLGIGGRLPALIAQALDELILNAIFDAPVGPDGKKVLHHLDRNENFEVKPHAKVTVEFADSEHYLCVAVEDHCGTLRRSSVLEALGKHYRRAQTKASNVDAMAAGLGYRWIVESGMSLLISVQQKSSTRVSLFFPRTASFKEFRSGFQFVSLFCD